MFKLNFLLTNEQLGRIQICLMKLKNGQYTYQSGMRIELSFLIAAQWRSSYHRYRRTDGWAFPLRRVNLLSAGMPCCCSVVPWGLWQDSERTLRGLGGLGGLCGLGGLWGLWEDSVDSGRTLWTLGGLAGLRLAWNLRVRIQQRTYEPRDFWETTAEKRRKPAQLLHIYREFI